MRGAARGGGRDREDYEGRMLLHFAGHGREHDPGDPRFVGWGSAASQEARFGAFAAEGLLGGGSVLDVGCGAGALAGWLRARGWEGRYLGIDLAPGSVRAARRLRPGERFRVAGPAAEGLGRHDWVVASGIFFLPHRRWAGIVEETLGAMFARCRVAAAANFLSVRSERPDGVSRYADPAEVLPIAFRVSPRVSLRHDYLPNDFTVVVRRG